MTVKAQYKEKPCVLWLEKPYAIGGDVVIGETPPKLGRKLSECSQDEYSKLFQLGYTHFFEVETKKEKQGKKQVVKEDDAELDQNGVGFEDDTAATSDEG